MGKHLVIDKAANNQTKPIYGRVKVKVDMQKETTIENSNRLYRKRMILKWWKI